MLEKKIGIHLNKQTCHNYIHNTITVRRTGAGNTQFYIAYIELYDNLRDFHLSYIFCKRLLFYNAHTCTKFSNFL